MKVSEIYYTSKFARRFKKLPKNIQGIAVEKEASFRQDCFTPALRTHKLHGPFGETWAFSLTRSYRIIFRFETKDTVTFIDVGTHTIYRA
ncbi:MAG: type II toxin-antitoxin system mRNA interferase toxin, RelE/StbE family [bacterium]|nr:type II toxin-antitoxin system mRNA interferase toxin, RelE/StbE family [bacterium]